ncbi:MAG TPA: DUF4190 domain-containing protein [Candidatus Binatia bacterium]|jgi:hypothetical protein
MAGDRVYLAELRKLWQQNFVAAILTARLNHGRIPPETAAIAQGMDRAFRADRDINDAVEHAMGSLGISGGGGGGFGASSGLDPDEYMFNAAMGMIAAHRGNPPASPALQEQAALILTGKLDPLSAFELSSPQLAGTGLVGGVLALAGDMAPLLKRMGLFMAALAVPADEIPALLPEMIGGRPRTTSGGVARAPAGPYGARARTSSLAIASMVLGIASWFGLLLFASIPAIITGHMAKREIRDANGAVEGSGPALIGLVAGYANVVISVFFFGSIMRLLGLM